jgi:hypothetical protein
MLGCQGDRTGFRGIAQKHDKEWLYKWIHNPAAMIKSGDAAAVKVYEQ